MVFVYEDESVRVVVHTANLVGSDWENRTQAGGTKIHNFKELDPIRRYFFLPF